MDFVNAAPIFGRFTDRSRTVVRLAEAAAIQLHHDCVGAEHILLGLLREGSGVAAHVLKNAGLVEETVLSQLQPGSAALEQNIAISDAGHRVIRQAVEEARDLRHNYVGTEHLLLAVLREETGIAPSVLAALAPLRGFRNDVYDLLGHFEKIDK